MSLTILPRHAGGTQAKMGFRECARLDIRQQCRIPLRPDLAKPLIRSAYARILLIGGDTTPFAVAERMGYTIGLEDREVTAEERETRAFATGSFSRRRSGRRRRRSDETAIAGS